MFSLSIINLVLVYVEPIYQYVELFVDLPKSIIVIINIDYECND